MDKTIDQICNKNNSSTHLNFSYHVPFFLPLLEDDLQLSKKKKKKSICGRTVHWGLGFYWWHDDWSQNKHCFGLFL